MTVEWVIVGVVVAAAAALVARRLWREATGREGRCPGCCGRERQE